MAFAKVTSLVNTNSSAKAGVMFRNSTAANDMFVDMVATPGNGVSLQWRSTVGGNTSVVQVSGVPAPSAGSPVWVKLVRSTNSFTGWYSTDGATWLQVGSAVTVNMASTAPVGLAVTSRNNNLIGGATFNGVGIVSTQVTNNLDSGPGSLRQALLNAATIPGPPQTMRFTLPAGSQTINLLTPLPAIGEPLVFMLDSTQHVTIAFPSGPAWTNSSALTLNGSGTLTLRGAIEGSGDLAIGTGGALTSDHIAQSTLVIGGTPGNSATVTIAASDADGNPLNTVAASNTSAATSEMATFPRTVSPTTGSALAVETASSLTPTANSSEPRISVTVAPSPHDSSGSELVVKSNFSDSAGLMILQSSSEIGGASGLAYSVSNESEQSSSFTTTGVSSTSDASTFLERQNAILANENGELLRRDAVAAEFEDADILEWATSTPSSRLSAAAADISLLADDLLDAIGRQWRN